MSQIKVFNWENANPAVARDIDVGFVVAEITTIDITNGGSWQWVTGMAEASSLDVDAGTISGSNGFTTLLDGSEFGAAISNFTNANPGVITASNAASLGFAAGDTIKVAGVADDATGTLSLNGSFTVASVTATKITLVEDTLVTGYSVWVSGGFASRVSDTNGIPVATENVAIRGMTIGTTPVGANSASMVAIVKSTENVS
jgi:hypothetical protein